MCEIVMLVWGIGVTISTIWMGFMCRNIMKSFIKSLIRRFIN